MNVDEVSVLVGKSVKEVINVMAVGGKDDFAITHSYEKKVKELGYDIGSMARDMPRALAKNTDIEKWYNIPLSDYPRIEGVVLCNDGRNGDSAKIVIFA
jgi:hypothetical protein